MCSTWFTLKLMVVFLLLRMGVRCAKGEEKGKKAVPKVFHLFLGGGDEGLIGGGGRARIGEMGLDA